MRRSTPAVLAVVIGMVVATFVSASPAISATPPIPLPANPTGLQSTAAVPPSIDPPARYQPQTSCYPVDKPGAVKLRNLVLATYGQGGKGNISRGCTEGVSEHSEGRAWDWMIDPKDAKQKKAAADFLSWATKNKGENARRLGIMYMIHNEKIWAVYREQDGWRASSGHTDHIHISLSWNGARGATSFWTGKVSPVDLGPCVRFTGNRGLLTGSARTGSCLAPVPELYATQRPDRAYGSTGQNVKDAQALLGVSRTGRFDSATWSAVRRLQQANDIVYTGVIDGPTWRVLDPSSVTKGPSGATYSRSRAIAYGASRYQQITLQTPLVAGRVVVLQAALGMPMAQRNGSFGAKTKAAVIAMQKDLGLQPDGVVGGEEWKAMQADLG